jgi:hypothetical protein
MSLRTAFWSARRGLYRAAAMALVILVFGGLGASVSGSNRFVCSGSPTGETRMHVALLATQAYARWSMDHPGRTCPTYIDELASYGAEPELLDRWGTRMEMVCSPPVGDFGVVSAGPDRRLRTSDDIHSWDSGRAW